MGRLLLSLIIVLLMLPNILQSQDDSTESDETVTDIQGSIGSMNETLLELRTAVDALRKIKVSGYIQTQFQTADTAGISSFAGGNFPANVRSRFSVRRGRLKVNYDNDLTQYVLQIDVTQNGVGIKDAFASIKDPWLRTLSFTAGAFDRPFGFEISYSSNMRESPERSRLFQTLFPGEREVGARIDVAAEEGPWSYFNLKAGLFNGMLNNANENDRNKDFIGRMGFQLPLEEQNLAIDGGVSLYAGKVSNNSKFVYDFDPTSTFKRFKVDSTASNVTGNHGRVYYGGDMEIYHDIPFLGGLSIRGEYITGQQPGTAGSHGFYNPTTAGTPLYIRNFNGWYVAYIQNIGLSNQLIVKYDVLDPNTDIEGSDIGAAGSNFSVADIKYSTLGLGWVYHWDATVKFTAYYDFVTNETINADASGSLVPFKADVQDNVFTLRMQYRF